MIAVQADGRGWTSREGTNGDVILEEIHGFTNQPGFPVAPGGGAPLHAGGFSEWASAGRGRGAAGSASVGNGLFGAPIAAVGAAAPAVPAPAPAGGFGGFGMASGPAGVFGISTIPKTGRKKVGAKKK